MSPEAERRRDVRRAARLAERAVSLLVDASTIVASAGLQQPSRSLSTATHDAAQAIMQAEADITKGAER